MRPHFPVYHSLFPSLTAEQIVTMTAVTTVFETLSEHVARIPRRRPVLNVDYAKVLMLALAAVIALGGCASTESVKQAKGKGIKRTYRQPADAVFQAVLAAAPKRKLELVEQDRAAGLIVLSSGTSLTSIGERIAVFITRAGERSTAVEIVSKPVGGVVTFPPDWPSLLFGDIEVELAALKLK